MLYTAAIVISFCLAAEPVPWHLSGWRQRAVVQVAEKSADAGVDAAAVKVLCQGRARADGADYRVVDAGGQQVPFQLLFHAADKYSLVAFRSDGTAGTFYIYFGNADAELAPEQAIVDPTPGAGPPTAGSAADGWVPHCGLTFATAQRPDGENPANVEELRTLMAQTTRQHGARLQRAISDGYNPFGSSDNYTSAYRGWINLPASGTYQFCTASNEASFSFLDGKDLVHWPGRHTSERGERGEKNVTIDLMAGLHYVEYYQEEVFLQQMSFLGWRLPGQPEGIFSPIPETAYPAPHIASVAAYESPAGPSAVFEPAIVDSIWPAERHEGQYTRVRFRAEVPDSTACHWNFGDGLSGEGTEAEHVYLALGNYNVELSTSGADGPPAAVWPLEVYEIQHVTAEIAGGNPSDYAELARAYDREKLDAAGLKELAHLLSEGEDPATGLEIGKLWIERHAAANAELTPRVRRLMADCALRLGSDGLDEAIANFQASINEQTPPAEKLDVLGRLIYLLGIERGLPEKAGEVLGQVEETVRGVKLDEEGRAAYRRAIIAAGDSLLWQGQREGARDLYKRAELASGKKIPPQVRAARIGAYPNAIRDFLAADDTGAALATVREWEEAFPTEKLAGQTFYWHGKLLFLSGQNRHAAQHLARAASLGTGAAFESEARWLLACSLDNLGKPDEANKELARLIGSGANDQFSQKARERLKARPGR
ncbi:MAG: PKD domain-containing protein [Pirellulales bacterium]